MSQVEKTGLVLDSVFCRHDTGWSHPEGPERVAELVRYLETQDVLERCKRIAPVCAKREAVSENHSEEYLERLESACRDAEPYIDTPDSAICNESFEIALLAVGAVLELVDGVMESKIRRGLALVRPPGHHAEAWESKGFCLFNNVAIAARHLLKKYALERVLILDWDVHHGNGTQHSFEEDSRVFFASMHGHPYTLFPGTGFEDEVGIGKGRGTTLNMPMMPGCGNEEFRKAFDEKVVPAVEKFRPEFILISSGFDAHAEDPVGTLQLYDESYGWLTRDTVRLAEEYCGGRIVSVLEGGYNLEALCRCVTLHLEELSR